MLSDLLPKYLNLKKPFRAQDKTSLESLKMEVSWDAVFLLRRCVRVQIRPPGSSEDASPRSLRGRMGNGRLHQANILLQGHI